MFFSSHCGAGNLSPAWKLDIIVGYQQWGLPFKRRRGPLKVPEEKPPRVRGVLPKAPLGAPKLIHFKMSLIVTLSIEKFTALAHLGLQVFSWITV
ncbi:hypothetical protein CEXT_76411 [Caerostris extrusa]|uniref:Uncharacterized protein n=1 Tax=Caerostris extrusa TaxID=172846 RepID=A0AAV4QJC2_CAEEX|nr:hypothetical protein CEXT_76411 [Caerostris extrusa]